MFLHTAGYGHLQHLQCHPINHRISKRSVFIKSTYDVEEDPRYRRFDMSEVHSWECRMQFAGELYLGLGRIHIAKCSCLIAAEDDAIVSHSTVKLPVKSFMNRIDMLAQDIQRQVLTDVSWTRDSPMDVLKQIEGYLFGEQGFKVSQCGKTSLSPYSIVDHPGVWENPNLGYLTECLIRKESLPSTLAILYSGVGRSLVQQGWLPFGMIVNENGGIMTPVATPFEVRQKNMLIDSNGNVLNACSLQSLIDQLSHLKRSFWPFSWQCGAYEEEEKWLQWGGFKGAAEALLFPTQTPEHAVITQTAANRQARGVWTSTGGGDLRRAIAACERLVLVNGEEPLQRRDLAVLYAHNQQFAQAKAELGAFLDCSDVIQDTPPNEQKLAAELMHYLKSNRGISNILTLDAQLNSSPPQIDENRKLPLTW